MGFWLFVTKSGTGVLLTEKYLSSGGSQGGIAQSHNSSFATKKVIERSGNKIERTPGAQPDEDRTARRARPCRISKWRVGAKKTEGTNAFYSPKKRRVTRRDEWEKKRQKPSPFLVVVQRFQRAASDETVRHLLLALVLLEHIS